MYVALRFWHGEEIPWSGRILGGTIHLGPIYYWLLALFLALTGSWLGTVALLGLLASLKVTLAYLVGKELHSRRAGFLYAVGLFVPCWGTFEWLFPGHNLLTTPLTLAFLLCAARYWRHARRRYLVAMAGIFVVALHAHPTASGLAWIGLALLMWAGWRRKLRAGDVLIASAVALIPLAPYFIWDASHGFSDLHAGGSYLSGGESTGQLSAMLPIFQATAFGGTRYWFSTILDWPKGLSDAACVLISLGGLLGILGALRVAIRSPRERAVILAGLCALFFVLLSTALIRNVTPYYQTIVLRTVLTGVVAIGLASLGEALAARVARTLVVATIALSYSVCFVAFATFQARGDFPLSFFPLFDVGGESTPVAPFLGLPAYAIADTSEFLCASPAPSVHGVFAQQVLHDYAMGMRLACNRSDVQLGGSDASREHWLGLSRAMFEEIRVSPQRYLGPLGVVPAHPVALGAPLNPQTEPVYPAYKPATVEYQARRVAFRFDKFSHLAISDIAWSLVPAPEVQVRIDGKPQMPVAADTVVRIYARPAGGNGNVEVEISSIDPADVDVVLF